MILPFNLISINEIESIFTILGTIGGIISLIYLAIQIRDNTTATKGNTYLNMINSIAQFENTIIINKDVAELYHRGIKGEKLNEIEQIRFNELLSTWFNYFENFYFQYNKKLIEQELWIGWQQNMLDSLQNESVLLWWNNRSSLYSKSFRNMIEENLKKDNSIV